MTVEGHPGRSRVAAIAALVALAAALVYVTVAAGRNLGVLLLCAGALGLAVVASWWVVSRRGRARMVAGVVAVTAIVAFVVVVVVAVELRVLVVAGLLGAGSVMAARLALHTPRAAPVAQPRPRHPVLLINPRSGGGKAGAYDLPGRCRELGIEPVVLGPGDDLVALAHDAVRRGADVLGMAGGDGSQALVAGVASGHGIPFVVVPAGTRNHLALDLGVDRSDVAGALEAFGSGIDRTIDLAEVNGRVFVNNASMGAYAKIVQSEDYRDAKLRTALSVLPDLVGPDSRPLDLRYEGPAGTASGPPHVLLVSNNPYLLSPLPGGGTRERLDGGCLGIASIVVVGAPDRSGRRPPVKLEWTATEFRVDSSAPVEVGVDGEALVLDPPLEFRIRPAALTVRVSRAAAERAARVRIGSRSAFRDLWRIAIGADGQGVRP